MSHDCRVAVTPGSGTRPGLRDPPVYLHHSTPTPTFTALPGMLYPLTSK